MVDRRQECVVNRNALFTEDKLYKDILQEKKSTTGQKDDDDEVKISDLKLQRILIMIQLMYLKVELLKLSQTMKKIQRMNNNIYVTTSWLEIGLEEF